MTVDIVAKTWERCSFCFRDSSVNFPVAGPRGRQVAICAECVAACLTMMASHRRENSVPPPGPETRSVDAAPLVLDPIREAKYDEISELIERLEGDSHLRSPSSNSSPLGADHCSFCDRGPSDFEHSVEGPSILVCNRCATNAELVLKSTNET